MIGSCRISIDWIMRGARISFWSIRWLHVHAESHPAHRSVSVIDRVDRGRLGRRSGQNARRPSRASASIWVLANSSDDPVGNPRASRVTVTPVPASRFEANRAVPSPSRVGLVARITSRTPPRCTRWTRASSVSWSGPTSVERGEPAAEHVVQPAVAAGPLERRPRRAASRPRRSAPASRRGSRADRAQLPVGQVEALPARPDLLGHGPQGVGQGDRRPAVAARAGSGRSARPSSGPMPGQLGQLLASSRAMAPPSVGHARPPSTASAIAPAARLTHLTIPAAAAEHARAAGRGSAAIFAVSSATCSRTLPSAWFVGRRDQVFEHLAVVQLHRLVGDRAGEHFHLAVDLHRDHAAAGRRPRR